LGNRFEFELEDESPIIVDWWQPHLQVLSTNNLHDVIKVAIKVVL